MTTRKRSLRIPSQSSKANHRSKLKSCLKLLSLERRDAPAAFTPGNLVVYRVGDGINNLTNTGSAVFIDEYLPLPDQKSPVQSIVLPSAAPDTSFLVASGTATSEGALTLSPNGGFLAFTGYNRAVGGTGSLAGTAAATVSRVAAVMDSNGAFSLTNLSDFSDANNPRGAVTTDGYNIWVTGAAGAPRYAKAGSTTSTLLPSTAVNSRVINIVNGQLYVSSGSGTTRLATVGTGVPTTGGQTVANLPGADIAGMGSPYGYFFADLSGSVAGIDTLYVADDSAGLIKFTFDGTNWSKNNTLAVTSNGLRGLTGTVSGSTVTLYATNSFGAAPNFTSNIYSITDTSGYGANNNGTFGTPIATLTGNTQVFRGIAFAPTNSMLPTTVASLTTPTTQTSGPSVTYTATFNAAVAGLSAANFTLTKTGSATGVIGTPTGSGTTWSIPVTGISGGGTIRLDLTSSVGVTPPVAGLPFEGTTVDVSPPSATLDVVGGTVNFAAALGKANNVSISVSGGTYTISDSKDVISLTTAAKNAGWMGSGTNTVTGPDGPTTALNLDLGDGVDTFTLNSVADPLSVTSNNDAGSNANLPANVTLTGKLNIAGFESIAQSAGVLLSVDTLTLAGGTIGSQTTPIHSKATTIVALGSDGGVFLLEDDGADLTVSASGAGAISVVNTAGSLAIAGASTFGSGAVALSSGDGLAINAALGDLGSTGTIALAANTNGVGAEGFTMGASGSIKTSSVDPAAFALTVNTAGSGTGNANLGAISVGGLGTITIDANLGSIFATGVGALSAGGGVNTFPGSIILKTSGAGSAVGTAAQRIFLGTGNLSVEAGAGGIFITETTEEDTVVAKATAKGIGAVDLYCSAASSNGWQVTGLISSDSGPITIRADDNFTLVTGGTIGGPGYSGKIIIEANLDGQNQQSYQQVSGSIVQTTSTAADAVTINVSGSTVSAGIPGAILGNIGVGDGGGITINVAKLLGNATDSNRAGIITMFDNAVQLDAGPTGSITLIAKNNNIGTSVLPVRAVASSVAAQTNSIDASNNALQDDGDIFVVTPGPTSFSGATTTIAPRIGDINFTTISGALSLNGNVTTDDGFITLTSAANIGQTAGKVTTTGALNLNYTGSAIFTTVGNTAGSVTLSSGQVLQVDGSLTLATPITIDGTLSGVGTVSSVNVTAAGKVAPGTSPGILSTGSIAFSSGSQFIVELNGATAGTGYDQLKVVGTVDLAGTTLVGSLGFVPGSGQKFTFIDNDGSDAVVGTFNGLAEGAKVNIGGTDFTLTYKGGTGNDVVLTAPGVAAPAAKISSISVNGGGVQRSMFTSLVVTFDSKVSFVGSPASAFTVQNQKSSNFATLAAGVDGTGTIVTVTFTGGSVDLAGSLSDGRYTLTVLANQFAGSGFDGNGDGTGGDNFFEVGTPTTGNKLFRLFGDADGNGTVNTADFNAFRSAFGGSSVAFDYDGLGGVGTLDFNQFRTRFGSSV